MTNKQAPIDTICKAVTFAQNSTNKVKQPNFPKSKPQGKPLIGKISTITTVSRPRWDNQPQIRRSIL